MQAEAASSSGPLDGLRVLDLADESGALAGKLLGDLGADVVAVEPPGGMRARTIGPFWRDEPHPNRSLFHWYYATSKRSIVLDLESAAGRDAFHVLAEGADVLIQTGAPGALARRNLDYETLAARNPRLVVASITPFGRTGPWRDRGGSELVAAALAGMVYVNGFPNATPLHPLGPQGFHCAGLTAAIGILCALYARPHLGRGQHVDVSVLEATAACVEHAAPFFHQNGTVHRRGGSLHWTRYFRVGRCRDGHVLHCTLGDWTSLVEWVAADGKAEDLVGEEWEDFNHRRVHAEHLFDVLDGWVKDHTVAEIMDGAQLRRIPYAIVRPPEAQLDDPQLAARGFFVPVDHPELGVTIRYPGAPCVFEATPWRIRRRPPLLGEHTAEVLAASGLDARAITAATGEPFASSGCAGASAGAEVVPAPDLRDEDQCAERVQGPPPRPHSRPGHDDTKVRRGAEQSSAPRTEDADGRVRALDGIVVLDFTWVVAGPLATRLLADHGARVIKVERRDALDFGTRRGGFTGNLNRGKESIVLAMNHPDGLALARRLVACADVVIDNFSARVMRNWGLDYAGLAAIRPDVIAVSMSGFGLTGPQRDYVSYGPTLQALAGFTAAMRDGDEPAGWGYSFADVAAGHAAALATVAALHHRARSGRGQLVDLAQLENTCALVGPALLDAAVNARPVGAPGNASQERAAAPYGVYPCRGDDRWCAITVFDDAQWAALRDLLGDPDWMRDPTLATATGRVARAAVLDGELAAWTRTCDATELMERLQRAGIPAGVVADAVDLCTRNPQLAARGYWTHVATPEGDTVTLDGIAARLDATPGFVAAPGPLLGEHTDRVLRDLLGLSPDEMTRLRETGAIG